MSKVPLTSDAIQEFLDKAIAKSRGQHEGYAMNGNSYGTAQTACSIEAYQHVREVLLGKRLPEGKLGV